MSSWSNNLVLVPDAAMNSMKECWNSSMQGISKEHKRTKAAVMIYTVWHIWNERNRGVFTDNS
jgi:hypothetical protein